jgi:hypothetical protein
MPLKTMGCGCRCGGPFDWYGPAYQATAPPLTDLVYRVPSVTPGTPPAAALGFYSSVDDGWQVDVDPDGTDDQAKIYITNSPHTVPYYCDDTKFPLVWVSRHGNEDHPEAGAGAELLADADDLAAWDQGATADYDDDADELSVNTAAATSAAWLEHDPVTVTDGTIYRGAVLAKQKSGGPRWIRLILSNMSSATSAQAWCDLQTHTIHLDATTVSIGFVGTVLAAGNGEYQYALRGACATPSGQCEVRIQLVDGDGATSYDGEIDDAAVVISASLRAMAGGNGYDVMLVKPLTTEVEWFHYLSKSIFSARVPGWFEYPSTTEEEHAASLYPSRRAAQANYSSARDTTSPYNISTVLMDQSIFLGTNGDVTCCWASDAGIGYIEAGQSSDTESDVEKTPPGYAATVRTGVDVILAFAGDASNTVERLWGSTWVIRLIATPYTPADEVPTDGYGRLIYPLPTRESLPAIVGASPHAFPKVWSVANPLGPGFAWEYSPIYPTHSANVDIRSVTCDARIYWGDFVHENRTVNINASTREEITLPVIYGGDDNEILHLTSTQDRVVNWAFPTESGGPAYITPHCWLGVTLHDASPSRAICIAWEAVETVTVVDTYGEAHWYEGNHEAGEKFPTEPLNLRTRAYQMRVRYKAPAASAVDLFGPVTFWGPDEAHIETGASRVRWQRVTSVLIAQRPAGVDPPDTCSLTEAPVWIERLFSSAPTAESAGTPSGLRIHYDSASNPWTLDSPFGERQPVLQQSSDKHLFVSDFWLCDPRMEITGGTGRVGYNWVISHEGDWLWPQRVEQQPDDDDLNQNGAFSNPAAILHESVAFDCIKDSSLDLSPELHRHATRTGTWYTQHSEALGTWDLGAHAAYVGDRLELSGNRTGSTQVELSRDDLEVSALMKLRIMVTAAAAEKDWLLVRWEGFEGTGEHAHVWIDLTNKQISGTTDLNIDAMSVEDIGGGVARYLLTVSNAAGDFAAGHRLLLRIVDGDGDDDVTGSDGDGVRLISCIVQRQCIS